MFANKDIMMFSLKTIIKFAKNVTIHVINAVTLANLVVLNALRV